MKKNLKRVISGMLAVAMAVTLMPVSVVEAKADEAKLRTQLRNSVSDKEYPNGVLGFAKTQISVTEGGKKKITVVRQGNTDKDATVHFKAIDVSAEYGSDYLLTVVHSGIKKEQLEADKDSKPLVEQNASLDGADTDVIVSDTETDNGSGEKAKETDKQALEVKSSKGAKSGLSAAYKLQNDEKAPEYDWKETNPENASQEITDAMGNGKEKTVEYLRQAAGVETVLKFKSGEYKKEIICETLNDDKAESEEQIAFFLYDSKGTKIGADYNGYVNIKDDEQAEDNNFSVKNGRITVKSDENVAKVTVIRKSGINQMAFVKVGTKSKTALPGEDYEAVVEEVLFPAGTMSKTVEIPIIGERTEDKEFYVGISEDGVVADKDNQAALVTIQKQKSNKEDGKGISAKGTEQSVNVSNKGWIGNNGAIVARGIDFQLADKITIQYEVQGVSSTKKCKKTTYYKDKKIQIYVRNQNNKNVLTFSEDKIGKDSYSGSKSFSRSFEKSSEFNAWDSLSNANIWVSASGLNGNSNASVRVTSIKVNYPGFTFQINNDSTYNHYTEKQFTSMSGSAEKGQIRLGKAYLGKSGSTNAVVGKTSKLSLLTEFSNEKNSQGVPANSRTVEFKGYRLVKPKTQGKYSNVINLSNTTINKSFLNTYKDYMFTGRTFSIVPVFEPKKAEIYFNNNNAAVGSNRNAKGNFKGYPAGSKLNGITKLDTIVIAGAANKGYAVNEIQLQSGSYSKTNADENNDKTKLTCGLGDNSYTSYTASLSYETANIKVVADPKFKNTAEIKRGSVIYTDDDKNVFKGDYKTPLTINNVIMNKTYNIIGVAENGYRTVWRDGTLDYDGDGETTDKSSVYFPFTPVVGNVLPYTAKIALGKVYYSFEKQQPVGTPTDIYGYVKIRDRFILTGRKGDEFVKGVNGANVTADGEQVTTSTGGTNKKNQSEGFFRISSNTFSVKNYYLVNVNAYGDEGSINTSFVMNPGHIKDCVIDTEDDLTISNAEVFVERKKDSGDYEAVQITTDGDGYFSELTNGDKNYRLRMKADKSGVSIKSGQLQFYDADGKRLSQTVEGKPENNTNDGYIVFNFNPQSLSLSAGTTLRVTFTDNQGHTYLQREVGMSLSESIGVLDVANSFTFGGANTVVKMIGKVDSKFNFGWNGDFDDTFGDNIAIDEETGDKIISVGFNKEALRKKTKRSAIQLAADSLAKKEKSVADANKKLSKKNKELSKKKNISDSDKKSLEKLQKNVQDAYSERDKERKNYDDKVRDAQNPQKTHVGMTSNVSLKVAFSFVMTFGRDSKNKYYFKSMVLSAGIEGGVNVTVNFATPIGITINLGFSAGGSGEATFVVEERKDQLNPKKYYIQDITEKGSGQINVFDCNMENINRKFDGYGSFSLKPYIGLSVGAGVLGNLISVSIDGRAQLDMQFYTAVGENNGTLNLSAALTLKILMIQHSWTIASTDINLFGNSGGSSLGLDNLNYLYDSADVMEAEDIGYMAGGSKWKSGKISAKSIDESKDAYVEASVADKIAQNPDFKMISIGDGEYLAVFTNTDPNRASSLNAKAIYYTIYNKANGWSAPVLVEDDGTLDQDPNVFDLGKHGAVITWSTADKLFTDETSRVDMQNSMDLHCVFFNKDTKKTDDKIQSVTKHTTDNTAGTSYDNYSDYCGDVSANVSYNDNKMIIYYQKKEYSSEGNEYLGDVIFPKYSLMAARTYSFAGVSGFDGSWNDRYSQEEMQAMKKELIDGGLSETVAGERAVAYENCFYGQRMFNFLPSVSIEEKLDDDGYWESEPKISEIDGSSSMIIDTDAMSYNDLGVFAYTIDYDGDLKTCGDRDMYMQIYDFKSDSFMHPVVLTSDSVEDSNVQFVRVQNETYLSWLHNGNIVALDMSNIVGNYNTLLKQGETKAGDKYYYINKTKPANNSDSEAYIPPITIAEGEVADADNAVSAISSFDVEASDNYVYFMWTQKDSKLKDGIEEGTPEADDPKNALTETQLYTVRYDVAEGMATKPVQVTSGKGVNYSDVAFKVENDNLIGLVYKANSKIVTLEEYNEKIRENNANAEKSNGNKVEANDKMDEVSEYDYTPYSEPDIKNAVPCSFRVVPRSVIKIKNAEFGEKVAGQDTTLTFDVLNDGVDTVQGLKLTATNKAGKSVLLGNNTTEDTGADGTVVTDTTTAVVDSINLDKLYGGYSYSGVCQVAIAEDASDAEVTIKVTDKDGNELVSEKISETVESRLNISDLKAVKTDVRNQYTVTGTIINDGSGKENAGKIEIGSVKQGNKTKYETIDYPELPAGGEFEFEKTITVSPNAQFEVSTDEEGNVTETGTIYANAGSANAETLIERVADAEEIQKVKAIKDVSLENAKKDSLTVKNGESVLLTPVMSSTLADKANDITGDEGLQYKFVSDNEKVLAVDSNGVASAMKAGTANVTMCVYPKDNVFVAANQSDSKNVTNNVLGQYEDAYVTVPESAIYKKTFTVKVSESKKADGNKKPLSIGKTFTSKGNKYKVISSGQAAFTGVKNAKVKNVKIPATVKVNGKSYKVTSVSAKALSGKKKLTSVTIGKNVKTIGNSAFKNCKKLKKITIPQNVTRIMPNAFSGCSALKSITVKSKKLKSVGKNAFKGIHKKAVFKLSGTKKQKNKQKKLFTKKTGFKSKSMKIK